VVNLAILRRFAPASVGRWIAAGALLPDVPMLLFYIWERGMLGASERHIWSRAYFDPAWQHSFDAFNSAPIFALVGLAAWAARRSGPAWLCASGLLHVLGDAFVHREDGHRHLWPVSSWRFETPVSYWDPAHHGAWGAGLETLLVFGSTLALWPAAPRAGRVALAVLCVASGSAWIAFYALGWAP